MADKKRELLYVEPIEYFSKSTRKKYKIGEYAEDYVGEKKEKPAKEKKK